MARKLPLWQQSGTYAADLDRQLIAATIPGGGVIGGAVTPVTNTMTLSVAPGSAVVPLASGQGSALCVWDAAEVVPNPPIVAPGPGTSRIDLVVVQYRDSSIDAGANNDFIVSVVTGTAAANAPSVPAVPPNALALAAVTVPGAAANLNGTAIARMARQSGTDPAWIPVTLQNGFTGGGQYRRINGMVYLRNGVTGTTGQTAFTLPPGYRPSIAQHFIVRTTSSINTGELTLTPNGQCSCNSNFAGTQYYAIDGIVFDADGS